MKRKYQIAVVSKGAFARTLRIYAPKSADRAIIMHDGQNVFYDADSAFNKSWRALELLKHSGIKNTAIIGIDNSPTRDDDYMPFPTELSDYGVPVSGGNAIEYCDYISDYVIPYLDKRFNFAFYGMLGSSAGALATLHYAARKDKRLRAYGMFSTPLFVSRTAYDEFFKTASFDADAHYSIYTGGSETVGEIQNPKVAGLVPNLFVDDAHRLTVELRKSGVKILNTAIVNTAIHDETAWRSPAEKFFVDFSKIAK